ncbi:MAG: hypothetical protein NTZ10_00725 [Candidatus Saganbacteria bacterium]|nr:hypothetical protein [Candidatus Saganbacteria bacterium]
MKKSLCGLFGFVLVFAFMVIGSMGTVQAEVNVNINIGPPPIVVSEPPQVVMMPQYGIYFVPGISYDVFFYNGYWWSPRGNSWYRARQYNGPWGVVQRNYVPGYLFKVPKNYREVYKKERPINYGQWKKQSQNNGDRNDQGRSNEGRGHKH